MPLRGRRQLRVCPVPRSPAPPPKTWARSSPSRPAALGALSRPLDSWLDTGREIPQGSVSPACPRPTGQRFLRLPGTLPSDGTCLLARPSQDDPPLPRTSPAPGPASHQEIRAAFQALNGSRAALRKDVWRWHLTRTVPTPGLGRRLVLPQPHSARGLRTLTGFPGGPGGPDGPSGPGSPWKQERPKSYPCPALARSPLPSAPVPATALSILPSRSPPEIWGDQSLICRGRPAAGVCSAGGVSAQTWRRFLVARSRPRNSWRGAQLALEGRGQETE